MDYDSYRATPLHKSGKFCRAFHPDEVVVANV
jgi:hypothetical protein